MSVVITLLGWFVKFLGFGFGTGKKLARTTAKEARTTIPVLKRAFKEGMKSGQELDIKSKLAKMFEEESEEKPVINVPEELPPLRVNLPK